MSWLLFSLVATFIWALGNVIDSDLIRGRSQSAWTILTVTGLFSLIPVLWILLSTGVSFSADWVFDVFGFSTGIVSLLAFYPYFRALESAHPASAVLLWNLSPALVVAGAFLFLGERLIPLQYLGICLLIVSAVLAGYTKDKTASKQPDYQRRVVLWMLLASVLTASQALMEKWLFLRVPTQQALFLMYLGTSFGGIVLLASNRRRKELASAFRLHGRKIAFNESLTLTASVVASLAISLGPVSLVKAAEGVQPLFVYAIAWIVGRFMSRRLMRLSALPSAGLVFCSAIFGVFGLWLIG